MASEVDIAKAKAEGQVTLYTSLDTKIVDAIVGPFKKKYGIAVEYFRGGSADVTSKVLAEADAGHIRADMVDASDLAASVGHERARAAAGEEVGSVRSDRPRAADRDGTWIADRLTQGVIQYNVKEFGGDKGRRPGAT